MSGDSEMLDAIPACRRCDNGLEGQWIVAGNPMCRKHAVSAAAMASVRPEVVLVTPVRVVADDPTPGLMLTDFWNEVREAKEEGR